MEKQDIEKRRSVFLDPCKCLFHHRLFTESLTLFLERLREFPMDADACAAAGELQVAMSHLEGSHRMPCDLENNVFALIDVFARIGQLYAKKGYTKEAQLCYQKRLTFNQTSESRQVLTSQGTAFEEMTKNKKQDLSAQ